MIEQVVRFAPPSRKGALARAVDAVGDFLHGHGRAIRRLQWVVVLAYVGLMVLPMLVDLPDRHARILNHVTVFAQFMFWGIWWPFVLLSMVLFGRIWCGVLCPEGALSEFASRHGRGGAIPRWMRWGGWPFVAFAGTTVYGQMVSVYQYPGAVALVLGGSTVAAMVVGYLYGRDKRVWCKYLCPVNGVFSLLSRLAPLHMKVDVERWAASPRVAGVNCAPLVPMRHMVGATDCHVCGRCQGYRGAIALTPRSPAEEIVVFGAAQGTGWYSVLIAFGMLGLAIGGFHWTVSPWFVAAKIGAAQWLAERDILWPFDTDIPWFVLTHYPDQNDVFNWLDGGLIVSYIGLTSLVMGSAISLCVAAASVALRRPGAAPFARRFHHLMQALVPLAACSLFLGLSATTITLLKVEGMATGWVPAARIALLAGANAWSLWLAVRIARRHVASTGRIAAAMVAIAGALMLVDYAWALMFWLW